MLTQGRLAAIISRLMRRMTDEELTAAPGVMWHGREGGIDDGRYGDPERDERPAFVREDEAGWESLGRLDRE